jgi:hypothetical protein
MGADLIIEYIYTKQKLDFTKENSFFWSRMRKAYHKRLESIAKKDPGYTDFEAETGVGLDNESAHALIDEAIDTLKDMPRDLTWIRVGEYTVFITGGMSWGDTPTDSCDILYKFTTLFPYTLLEDVLKDVK